MKKLSTSLIWLVLVVATSSANAQSGPVLRLAFDGAVQNATEPGIAPTVEGRPAFAPGLDGQALRIEPSNPAATISVDASQLPFDHGSDFSLRFWMRTDAPADSRFVLLSQKEFPDNSLTSQKNPGWVFYTSGGTWAWSMGSGSRRITYERDNGRHMPLNDGKWHQLAMTYSSDLSEVRLYYDGVNWVTYHVSDSNGFDFTNQRPLTIGGEPVISKPGVLPAIEQGAQGLQTLVDAFNRLGLQALSPDELIHLVVDPRRVFDHKVDRRAALLGADSVAFRTQMDSVDWKPVAAAESALMANPYTVHQVLDFVETAPLLRVYALVDGRVEVQPEGAARYAERERLGNPDFEMDELAVWDRVLAPGEVESSYTEHFEPTRPEPHKSVRSLTAACWNIWHGGKHWTQLEHGWDSRVAIADMLRDGDADVVMMQETYSSGDFIAAELGFYFATTVDWDYLNQGSNISVMSRWPITEVHIDEDSPFNDVGARVAVSETQDLYVMSNWYGMGQFPSVFDFHRPRFEESDDIPTLFAGDFNAVPHTDGGDSPASRTLMGAGFTDAYRSLYPNATTHPAPTHQNGQRIDQLYYRGSGLTNTATQVLSDRPGGFPSDHNLILSTFDLNYVTDQGGR